jgi:monoamine oxidase
MSKESRNGIGRRAFLAGTAAVVSAGATTALAQSATGTPKGSERQSKYDYDVVVIGGGFAGATAVRELGAQGYKALLLEARARLGGRTFTSRFAGQEIEFGGAWVHWLQPHVWAEMVRYGRGVVEDPLTDLDLTVQMYNDGSIKQFDPPEFYTNIQVAFEKLCHDAREIFPRPYEPHFDPRALELDKLSVRDRIDTLGLTKDQHAAINSYMALYGGDITSKFGLPAVLKLYACGAWNYDAFADAETHYRIEGGTLGLIEAMIEDSGAKTELSTMVTRIEQRAESVHITTEHDEVISAEAVVVTVPINTYRDIEFLPQLSDGRRRFADEGQLSQGCKLYVHVKQNLGRVFAFADEAQPLNWVQTHDYSDELGTVLSITVARCSTLDVNDDDEVAGAVRRMFPGVDVISSVAYDWLSDPFSRGAWAAYRVGQFSRMYDLQKPEGRLFFAGAATANGWHEFIDGAVESGLRVGREVRQLLG